MANNTLNPEEYAGGEFNDDIQDSQSTRLDQPHQPPGGGLINPGSSTPFLDAILSTTQANPAGTYMPAGALESLAPVSGEYNPDQVEDIGLAMQGNFTNWWNNLMNNMDELDISEAKGAIELNHRLPMQRIYSQAEAEGRELTPEEIMLINEHQSGICAAEERIARNEQDIQNSPVSQAWQQELERINMLGPGAWFSNDWYMQLSEDLAGTLKFQGPQMLGLVAGQLLDWGITVGLSALTAPATPFTGGGNLAAAKSVGRAAGLVVEGATVMAMREKESLAEAQGAFETALADWENEYVGTFGQPETEEQFNTFLAQRADMESQLRERMPELMVKNRLLGAQDLVLNRLLLGMNKVRGLTKATRRTIQAPSKPSQLRNILKSERGRRIAKYVGINTVGQYYGEGVFEEGLQNMWQKQYAEGLMQNEGTWLDDIGEVFAEDIPGLARAYTGVWDESTSEFIKNLTVDHEFRSAIDRGGKAAVVFGGMGSVAQSIHTPLVYHKVKRGLAKAAQSAKDAEQAANIENMNLLHYFERGQGGFAKEALRSLGQSEKSELTPEQAETLITDIDQKWKMYQEMESFFQAGISAFTNKARTFGFDNNTWWKPVQKAVDPFLRAEAWLNVTRQFDIQKETQERVNELQTELAELPEGAPAAMRDAIQAEIKAVQEHGEKTRQFHNNRFKNLIKGSDRKGGIGRLRDDITKLQRKIDKTDPKDLDTIAELRQELADLTLAELAMAGTIENNKLFPGILSKARYGSQKRVGDVLNNMQAYRKTLQGDMTLSELAATLQGLLDRNSKVASEVIDAVDQAGTRIQQDNKNKGLKNKINTTRARIFALEVGEEQVGENEELDQVVRTLKDELVQLEAEHKKDQEDAKTLVNKLEEVKRGVMYNDFYSFYGSALSSPKDDERQQTPDKRDLADIERTYGYYETTDGINFKNYLDDTEATGAERLKLMVEDMMALSSSFNEFYTAETIGERVNEIIDSIDEMTSNEAFSDYQAYTAIREALRTLPKEAAVVAKYFGFETFKTLDTISEEGIKMLDAIEDRVKKNSETNGARNESAQNRLVTAMGKLEELYVKLQDPATDQRAELVKELEELVKSLNLPRLDRITVNVPNVQHSFKAILNNIFRITPAEQPELYRRLEEADFYPGELLKLLKEDSNLVTPAITAAGITEQQFKTEVQKLADAVDLELQVKLFSKDPTVRDLGKKIYTAMIAQKGSIEGAIVPNFQQATLLMQLFAWVSGSDDLFVAKGYAGSGKTTTISKFIDALSDFGILPNKIAITASQQGIREVLRNRFPGIDSPVLTDLSAESLQGKEILVIDEAAYIDSPTLHRLYDVTKKAGVKLLLLGDPNQLAKNTTNINSLDDTHNMGDKTIIGPTLSIVSRTNIAILRQFQNRYIGSSVTINMTPVRGEVSKTTGAGLAHYGNIMDASKVASELKAKGESVIVLTDEKSKDTLMPSFEGIAVTTPDQVQGLEFDNVFIYMPPPQEEGEMGLNNIQYNKMMYVASTRAKKFVGHIRTPNEPAGSFEYKDETSLVGDQNFFSVNRERYNAWADKLEEVRDELTVPVDEVPEQEPGDQAPNPVDESVTEQVTEQVTEVNDGSDDGPSGGAPVQQTEEISATEQPTTTEQSSPKRLHDFLPDASEMEGIEDVEPIPDVEVSEYVPEQRGERPVDETVTSLNKKFATRPGDTKGAVRLFYLDWDKLKELVSQGKISKGQRIEYRLQLNEKKNDLAEIGAYITLDNGKSVYLGHIYYEADPQIRAELLKDPDSGFTPEMDRINKAVDSVPYDEIVREGSITVGFGEIKAMTLSGTAKSEEPQTVTKTFVEKLKNDFVKNRNSSRGRGKLVKVEEHIFIAVDDPNKTTSSQYKVIQALEKQFEGISSSITGRKVVGTISGDNPNYNVIPGRPYLVFVGKVIDQDNPGETLYYDHMLIEMQPRRLKPDDPHIQAAKTVVDQAKALREYVYQKYPDLKNLPESWDGLIHAAVLRDIENNEVDVNNKLKGMLGSTARLAFLMKKLSKNNPFLRDDTGDLDSRIRFISELESMVKSFEDGKSTYVPSWQKNPHYRGLYFPIEIPKNLKGFWAGGNDAPGIKNHPDIFETRHQKILGTNLWASFEPTERKSAEQTKGQSSLQSRIIEKRGDKPRKPRSRYGDKYYSSDPELLQTPIPQEFAEQLAEMYFGRKLSADEMKFVRRSAVSVATKGYSSWGYYRDGASIMATLPNGTVYKELVKHELFHKVFNELFTDKERMVAFRKLAADDVMAKELLEKGDYESMEEILANKFMLYTVDKTHKSIGKRLLDLFRRILAVMGFAANRWQTLDQMFKDIEYGFYASRDRGKPDNISKYRTFSDLSDRLGTPERVQKAYNHVKDALFEGFRTAYLDNTPYEIGDISQVLQTAVHWMLGVGEHVKGVINERGDKWRESDALVDDYDILVALDVLHPESLESNLLDERHIMLQRIINELIGVPLELAAVNRPNIEDELESELDEALIEDDGESISNISQAIDSSFKNPELTETYTVKAFMSMIPKNFLALMKGTTDHPELYSPGYMYRIGMDLFQDFNTRNESLEEFMTRKKKTITNRAGLNLIRVLELISAKASDEKTKAPVKIARDLSYVVIADKNNLEILEANEILIDKRSKKTPGVYKWERRSRESLQQLFDRVEKDIENMSEATRQDIGDNAVTELRTVLKQASAKDMINTIVSVLQSKQDKDQFTATFNLTATDRRKSVNKAKGSRVLDVHYARTQNSPTTRRTRRLLQTVKTKNQLDNNAISKIQQRILGVKQLPQQERQAAAHTLFMEAFERLGIKIKDIEIPANPF